MLVVDITKCLHIHIRLQTRCQYTLIYVISMTYIHNRKSTKVDTKKAIHPYRLYRADIRQTHNNTISRR